MKKLADNCPAYPFEAVKRNGLTDKMLPSTLDVAACIVAVVLVRIKSSTRTAELNL